MAILSSSYRYVDADKVLTLRTLIWTYSQFAGDYATGKGIFMRSLG
jgi:hypothetical protein